MQYQTLGKTGLRVSSLCLGTMTFGDGADEAVSGEIFARCRDQGINFFDCADVYANGESERILGRLIKPSRDQIIVATKAYYPTGSGVNDRGASRFHLTKALEKSLQNLQTDYVDIFYIHGFDASVAMLETLSTLNDFVRDGKVLYLGLSNFAAWQVVKAMAVCQQNLFAPIACIQPMYNLLKRQCEAELLPMAMHESLAVFPYSPLAGGFLTGKYLESCAGTGRFDVSEMYRTRYGKSDYLSSIARFCQFASENDYHPVSLAIAWVGSHPGVTAPIIGARNLDQLAPALATLEIEMTAELRSELAHFSEAPALATDREEERKGMAYKDGTSA